MSVEHKAIHFFYVAHSISIYQCRSVKHQHKAADQAVFLKKKAASNHS